MKKVFTKPEAKTIKFATRDIITSSDGKGKDESEEGGSFGGYDKPGGMLD